MRVAIRSRRTPSELNSISTFLKGHFVAYGVGVRWGKVTIIGVGLLGGSIGRTLKQRKLAHHVVGHVRRRSRVRECLAAGVVDQAMLDLTGAVEGADLVLLCTPISEIAPLALQLRPALKRGAIVTDVGSVKAPIVRRLGSPIRRAGGQFVGSHPMAGSAQGGVRFSRSDLFQGAVCVITPDDLASAAAVRKTAGFWRSLGARVLNMKASTHDRLVSRASHLPHLVASALANQILDPRQDKRQAQLCATGFRDTTRVAAGSAGIWLDIAMANRSNLIRDLARFERNLAELRQSLDSGDGVAVERFLSSAQRLREGWEDGRTLAAGE
jgi:prephenate dehydrogenase